MNIIVMSNEHTPIFVQKDEEPTSERNNQFFVYKMPKLASEIDPDFGQKIEDRLGHYIRTELKAVYETAKAYAGCRYSIPTPISDDERALFNVNMTGLEAEAEKILEKMVSDTGDQYAVFFEAGYLPKQFLNDFVISGRISQNGIVRKLIETGYLLPKDA